MNPLTIALLTFVCIFGCALFGLFLSKFLPEHHLSDESKDTVRLAAGLVATMVAIVLGMLVSSAKGTFDEMSNGITQMGAKIIQLDQVLAHYGPETKETRDKMRASLVLTVKTIWSEDATAHPDLDSIARSTTTADVMMAIRKLDPQTDAQRQIKAQALQIDGELMNLRWTIVEQWHKSLPKFFLVVLGFWMAMLFTSFGLFARQNATVIAALCIAAISVSGAVFLIVELSNPLSGMIKPSPAPFYKALEFIGK